MRFWGVLLLVMAGVFAFVVGSRLSADAVGMAIGVLFGVLAGIPTALLVLASGRRRRAEEDEEELDDGYAGRYGRRGAHPYGAFPPRPPSSSLPHRLLRRLRPSRAATATGHSPMATARTRHCPALANARSTAAAPSRWSASRRNGSPSGSSAPSNQKPSFLEKLGFLYLQYETSADVRLK